MASCSVQTLLTSGPCFTNVQPSVGLALELLLLCNIYQQLNLVASCDLQTLLNSANCFETVPDDVKKSLILQLLCEVWNASLTLVSAGHGSPEGVVTGNKQGQFYLDLDTGNKYAFSGVVGTKIGWI